MDTKTRDQTRLLEPFSEGDVVELTCETRGGDPRPRLAWLLENMVIDESFEQRPDGTTVNSLTFPNVGRQHLNARLVCQASNTNLAPPLTKLIILDINLRPLTVQILNKNKQLSADRSFEVECQTTGSRPEAVVTWWKGSRQLKRNAKIFSGNNSTTSLLTFVPEAEDHEQFLICRADNPRVPNSLIEDRWWLNVHYVPMVTLKMGSNLNPGHIKEGDDVYFECLVKANPKAHRLSWFKGTQEIQHNPIQGIILSDQSLVLQSVNKAAAGDYSCHAFNSEGGASSNPVSLQIRYAPICKTSDEGEVFGALKEETVELHCAVDSSPPPTSFSWTFNSSGEQTELGSRYEASIKAKVVLKEETTEFNCVVSSPKVVLKEETKEVHCVVASSSSPSSFSWTFNSSGEQTELRSRYAASIKAKVVLKEETKEVHRVVASSPSPSSFSWTFNSYGKQTELEAR
ncbi:hypothetical protein O0L34_g11044 [Tuta absoluta]|nr:hypothetical protein O0L34_g11044 [Tuta absoluta]